MNFLTVSGLIENFNNTKEKFGNLSSKEEDDIVKTSSNLMMKILIFLFIVIIAIIVIALYFWAIKCILLFKLPKTISILCILFLLMGQPLFAIIFAYIFKDRATLM